MSTHEHAAAASHTPQVRLLSLLDTDLYKLTMQQAVIRHFFDAQVTCTWVTHRPIHESLAQYAF